MKNLLIPFLLLFLIPSSNAVSEYAVGEYLNIWAISGLNMRISPDAKAKKIANIPFGEKVKVIDQELYKTPFSYTMARGNSREKKVNWIVKGYWVKVAFHDQEGYVFDGYLSKLPHFSNMNKAQPYIDEKIITNYGEENWGGLIEKRTEKIIDLEIVDPDKAQTHISKLTFKNGSYIEDIAASFSGETNLFIKNASLEEGYLFLNVLIGYEESIKSDKVRFHLISQEKDMIEFSDEDGLNYFIIKKAENGILIQSGGGC